MDLIETAEDLAAAPTAPGEGTRCVLVPALDTDLASQTVQALGLHLHPGRAVPRRPRAMVDGDQVDLVLFVLDQEGQQHRLEVIAQRDVDGGGGADRARDRAALRGSARRAR